MYAYRKLRNGKLIEGKGGISATHHDRYRGHYTVSRQIRQATCGTCGVQSQKTLLDPASTKKGETWNSLRLSG